MSCNMEKKSQSTNKEEDGMSTVRLWTLGNQYFIQTQSLFTHILSNIIAYLDIKASEG